MLGLSGDDIQRARKIELRLIQSKKIIENPSKKLRAKVFWKKRQGIKGTLNEFIMKLNAEWQ